MLPPRAAGGAKSPLPTGDSALTKLPPAAALPPHLSPPLSCGCSLESPPSGHCILVSESPPVKGPPGIFASGSSGKPSLSSQRPILVSVLRRRNVGFREGESLPQATQLKNGRNPVLTLSHLTPSLGVHSSPESLLPVQGLGTARGLCKASEGCASCSTGARGSHGRSCPCSKHSVGKASPVLSVHQGALLSASCSL